MIRLLFFVFIIFSELLQAQPFRGSNIVVSGPSPHLPKIVTTIYRKGGNVFDAAISSALSLSVTHPYYVSLGAGGFALLKKQARIQAIDFRESAPGAITSSFYTQTGLSSRKGGAAVAVPGFVAGLVAIHKKYGRLPWSQLIEPALQLAQNGFPASGDYIDITYKQKNSFNRKAKDIFLPSKKIQASQIIKQKQLYKALKLLKKDPLKHFYKGKLAQDIVNTVRQNKGVMNKKDFELYKVRWLKPIDFSFKNYKIYSMPLPSSGGIILSRAFQLIKKNKIYQKAFLSKTELNGLAQTMKQAFSNRHLMGDPENFLKDPTPKLLKESLETTHISLVDKKGSAVSMTLTLNGFYGSGLATQKYGIVLNNQMDDFSTRKEGSNMYQLIQGEKNNVIPYKRPLSSMSPVIVTKGKDVRLAVGGAGGPMIINGVLQVLYRFINNGLDIDQAIQAPRLHHQFRPKKLFVEKNRFSPDVIFLLKKQGHSIGYRKYMAQIFGVSKYRDAISGAHDLRREGSSGGY